MRALIGIDFRNAKLCLATMLAGALFFSCSKSPRQYESPPPSKTETPRLQSWSERSPWTSDAVRRRAESVLPTAPDRAQQDERARQISLLPIIYKKGAAGITFETTYAESLALLTKPQEGPDSEGYARYPSGMGITWHGVDGDENNRRPHAIYLTSDYQGVMEIGGEFGQIRTNFDLSRFFKPGEGANEDFIERLYRALEKPTSRESCLKQRVCDIGESEDGTTLIFQIPRAVFLVSRDRKQLYQISLFPDRNRGVVHRDFDLFSSEILLEGSATASLAGSPTRGASRIRFGQSLSEIVSLNGMATEKSVGRDRVYLNYDGVMLGFKRQDKIADFKIKDDLQGLKDLPLSYLYFGGGYNSFFRINGQLVDLEAFRRGEGLRLVSGEGDRTRHLMLKAPVEPEEQPKLISALAELLTESAQKASLKSSVFIHGIHKARGAKFPTLHFLHELNDRSGRLMTLAASGVYSQIETVSSTALDSDFDRRVLQTILESKSVDGEKILGLKIGQKVRVGDIDLGQDQAVVEVINGGFSPVRSAFVLNERAHYSFDDRGETTLAEISARLGKLETRVGLRPLKSPFVMDENPQEFEAQISSVGSMYIEPRDLCGIDGLHVRFGQSDVDFIQDFESRVAAARSKNSGVHCHYLLKESSLGSTRAESLTIFGVLQPKSNSVKGPVHLRIDFGHGEVTYFTYFVNPAEIEFQAGVGQ